MRTFLWALLLIGSVFTIAACTASQPQPEYRLTATIGEIMEHEVEPSADVLWDSVAEITNAAGTEQRQPRTDEDWAVVKHSAITLVEATNLILIPGRLVGHLGEKSENPGIELPPEEIQKRVDADRAAFAKMAHALHDKANLALEAINKKSVQGLLDAGAEIDEACEDCHLMYWYPKGGAPAAGTTTANKP